MKWKSIVAFNASLLNKCFNFTNRENPVGTVQCISSHPQIYILYEHAIYPDTPLWARKTRPFTAVLIELAAVQWFVCNMSFVSFILFFFLQHKCYLSQTDAVRTLFRIVICFMTTLREHADITLTHFPDPHNNGTNLILKWLLGFWSVMVGVN